jgi:hypothetical protein
MRDFNDYSQALTAVFSELLTATDRAAAIVAFSYLEETIRFGLELLYADDAEVTAALKRDHPSAAEMLRLLKGRIELEPEVLEDLEQVRRIRNRFAHWYDQVSFETGKVRQWCGSLRCWRHVDLAARTPRQRFTDSTQYICYRLLIQIMMQAP